MITCIYCTNYLAQYTFFLMNIILRSAVFLSIPLYVVISNINMYTMHIIVYCTILHWHSNFISC